MSDGTGGLDLVPTTIYSMLHGDMSGNKHSEACPLIKHNNRMVSNVIMATIVTKPRFRTHAGTIQASLSTNPTTNALPHLICCSMQQGSRVQIFVHSRSATHDDKDVV